MEWKERLSRPFKFTSISVSILGFLLYAGVFTAVLVADRTPSIPGKLGGLDLNKAYGDLYRITARPHPYMSRANDEVHAYLLDRLRPIVASQDYIELSEDLVSNASYVNPRGAIYFEAKNILVKVEGTDASSIDSGAVLFSAHYDSVSTAPGATDNGMSIATLLQLVEYFANPKRRPRRTAIFFFNNGEEDGLNGAHTFFEHRWSNQTASFINLEGAAAGGRPLLFRSNSLSASRSFQGKGVKHPNGNVIGADAFAQGVVRSGTDFEVFTEGIKGKKTGLSGIDVAFYKNRAYYHTPLDSIPGMGRDEGRKSLWAMMETARGAGSAMLNEDAGTGENEQGVYFDVLGRFMVSFSLNAMFITQVLLLIFGPVTVLGGIAWIIIFLAKDSRQMDEGEHVMPPSAKSRRQRFLFIVGWSKFWLTLFAAILWDIVLVVLFVKINPFTIHSRPHVVLAAILSFSFLAVAGPLIVFDAVWPSPPSALKRAIILEIYFLTWVILVGATVATNNMHLGSMYLVTEWNLCAWAAALIALAESIIRARGGDKAVFDLVGEKDTVAVTGEDHRFVPGIRYQPPGDEGEGEEVETEPTEITPLMHQRRRRSTGGREYIVGVDGEPLRVNGTDPGKYGPQHAEYGWWIFQMLALVPMPALLLFQIQILLQHSLMNTLADGSSPITVYAGLIALSTLVFLNLAPFVLRVHRGISLLVLLIFAICIIISLTAFPFTHEMPLKLFFQQSVELETSDFSSAQTIVSAKTTLTGLSGYVDSRVIPELPSSWGKELNCSIDNTLREGLLTCGWESELFPSPGGRESLLNPASKPQVWFTLDTERLNMTSARIKIRGTNTRGCRLYFDSPVRHYHVHGSVDGLQPGHDVPEQGVTDLILWSREWEKRFVVDVTWDRNDSKAVKMTGRAACEWAEYASATAGSEHAKTSAMIPALEEVIHFLPLWAVPTKWTYGLVEAWTRFRV